MSNFDEEVKHLTYTKKYMEMILQEAQERLGETKGNIQEALSQLNDKDSSLGYTSALSNARFLEMAVKEVETLNKIMGKPYFARIDFRRNGQDFTDTYYLGKTSLYEKETQEPIIVDWRSPVANVYYDGRLGEVSYESYEGEIEGYLSLKRQFRIENGRLEDFVDVDMMAADELLLEALSGKADHRLTEIVTTIQAEQNKVIRADLNKPIIVQGAAGSGKTTIALHRLSYFIYRYKDRFEPEQLMIIAPNNMFIGYIADVLPELGVEKIKQTTYADYVKKCIKGKFKVMKPEQKLISLINHEYENEKMVKWLSHFKGSLKYKKIIDRYLKDIRTDLCPTEDFHLEKFKLMSSQRLRHLFLKDYNYLPYYKRLEKIRNVLKTDVRQKKKQILAKLAKKYDDYLDIALEIKNDEKRREKVVHLMDTKDERQKRIENDAKVAVKNYMSGIPKNTLIGYYKQLFSDYLQFKMYAAEFLTDKQIDFFFDYNQKILAKNEVEMEDLAALFYMQTIIFGIDKEMKARNVVIDEAQDYSYFQLYALKKGLETDMFTIVGDLAQGIHSYRGIDSWDYLKQAIFPEANYVTLQKSYRTTIEIMNVANDILGLMKEDLPKVEPVVRHGEKPMYLEYASDQEFLTNVEFALNKARESGYQSVALIGKTETECKAIYQLIKKKLTGDVQLLKENEAIEKGNLVIVPSFLAKGLEFDVVLVVTRNEIYTEDEIDIKLLYVAMTRPMHRLYLIGKEKSELLLDRVQGENIEVLIDFDDV